MREGDGCVLYLYVTYVCISLIFYVLARIHCIRFDFSVEIWHGWLLDDHLLAVDY